MKSSCRVNISELYFIKYPPSLFLCAILGDDMHVIISSARRVYLSTSLPNISRAFNRRVKDRRPVLDSPSRTRNSAICIFSRTISDVLCTFKHFHNFIFSQSARWVWAYDFIEHYYNMGIWFYQTLLRPICCRSIVRKYLFNCLILSNIIMANML